MESNVEPREKQHPFFSLSLSFFKKKPPLSITQTHAKQKSPLSFSLHFLSSSRLAFVFFPFYSFFLDSLSRSFRQLSRTQTTRNAVESESHRQKQHRNEEERVR